VKKAHIWDSQKRGEPDPAVDDHRAQVLQEKFLIRFIKGQRQYNRGSEAAVYSSSTSET